MSNILVPSRRIWTRQPQRVVEIDWSDTITRGIISVQDGRNRRDVVSGSFGSLYNSSSISSAATSLGVGTNYNQNQIDFPLSKVAGSSTVGSILFVGELSSGTWNVATVNNGMVVRRYSGGFTIALGGSGSVYNVSAWSGVGAVVGIAWNDALARPMCFLNGKDVGARTSTNTDGSNWYLDSTLGGSRAGDRGAATYWAKPALLSVRWNRNITPQEAAALSQNPWRIFPRRRGNVIFVDFGASAGSTLNAAAAGTAQAAGLAQLAAQVSLAGIGLAVAGGQATPAVAIPLEAAGLAVAGGQAAPKATVILSAAGLAAAAGQAGLSASVLAQAAAAAQAAGNATLSAQLNALASGAAQAAGNASLTGGAPGSLAASGQATAQGSAVLTVTVRLQAAGAAQSGGAAAGSAQAGSALSALGQATAGGIATPTVRVTAGAAGAAQAGGQATGALAGAGQITAIGNSQSAGSASWTVTAQLTALGFVQAMGAGQLAIEIPLAALGTATAGGTASLSQVPDYIPALPLSLNAQPRRPVTCRAAVTRPLQLQHEVRRACR